MQIISETAIKYINSLPLEVHALLTAIKQRRFSRASTVLPPTSPIHGCICNFAFLIPIAIVQQNIEFITVSTTNYHSSHRETSAMTSTYYRFSK